MFLGLLDPDPSLFVRIRILTSTSKKERKRNTLISTILCILSDFSSLKTDVNVPSISNKQKKLLKILFVLASCQPLTKKQDLDGSVIQCHCHGSADPDPYQNVKDPQHCVFL